MKTKTLLLFALIFCSLHGKASAIPDTLLHKYWRNLFNNALLTNNLTPVRYQTDIRVELRGQVTPEDKIILYSVIRQLKPLIQSVQIDTVSRGGNLVLCLNTIHQRNENSILQGRIHHMLHVVKYRPDESFRQKQERYLNAILSSIVPHGQSYHPWADKSVFLRQAKISSLIIDTLNSRSIQRMEDFGLSKNTKDQIVSQIQSGSIRISKFTPITIYSNSQSGLTPSDRFYIETIYAKDAESRIRQAAIDNFGYSKYYQYRFRAEIKLFNQIYPLVLKAFLAILFLFIAYRRNMHQSRFSYLLVGWGIFFIITLFLDIINLSLTRNFGFEDAFSSEFMLQWGGATVAINLMFWFNRFMRKFGLSEHLRLILTTALIFVFGAFVVTFFYEKIDFLYAFAAIISVLFYITNRFILKQREALRLKDEELSRLHAVKVQAELQALQNQINPHFLFNSLNSISHLIRVDAPRAEQMTVLLSDLFRYLLSRDNRNFVPLHEELAVVAKYLEIEKIRFADKLDFTITSDEEASQSLVPRLIIQPLAENAIKHGISQMTEKGIITIEAHLAGNLLTVTVADNGPDFPDLPTGGTGLQNIAERLQLIYGSAAGIAWQNKPRKSITITIPQPKNR